MKTSEKRKYTLKTDKHLLYEFYDMIEIENYREAEELAQKTNDPIILQYLITLLCDELVRIIFASQNEY